MATAVTAVIASTISSISTAATHTNNNTHTRSRTRSSTDILLHRTTMDPLLMPIRSDSGQTNSNRNRNASSSSTNDLMPQRTYRHDRYYTSQTSTTSNRRKRRSLVGQQPKTMTTSKRSLLVDYSKNKAKEPLPDKLSSNVPLRPPSAMSVPNNGKMARAKAASMRNLKAATNSRRNYLQKAASVQLAHPQNPQKDRMRMSRKHNNKRHKDHNKHDAMDISDGSSSSSDDGHNDHHNAEMDESLQMRDIFGQQRRRHNNHDDDDDDSDGDSSLSDDDDMLAKHHPARSFLQRLNQQTMERPPAPLYGQLYHSLSNITHRGGGDNNNNSDKEDSSDDESVASTFSYYRRPTTQKNRTTTNAGGGGKPRAPTKKRATTTLDDVIPMPTWDNDFEQSLSSICTDIHDLAHANHRKKSFLTQHTTSANKNTIYMGGDNDDDGEDDDEPEDLLFENSAIH